MNWQTTCLGEHVEKVSTWSPNQSSASGTFRYIDLSSVDKDQKVISIDNVLEINCVDAPSRARQLVQVDDVLVSAVRPNLNGVAIVPTELDGATASTGYCVLRPNERSLYPRYLYHWVKTNSFVDDMVKKATGANYPAVSDKIIKESEIPLPPLPEQKRIAAILDKSDSLRRKNQQAIQLADKFLRAVFLDLFGDPLTNPKGLEIQKFGNVGTLDRGKSKHRPRNDPILLGGKHPLIQTGDVANSRGYIKIFSSTYSDVGLQQSKKWPVGTLCITIAANIAKTGILTFEACFPDSVVGFIPGDKVTTEYIQHWLKFLQKTLETSAPESAQKNINLEILRNLSLPLPDKRLQEKFSRIVNGVLNIENNLDNSLSEDLFNALSQKAFAGKL